MGSVDSAVGPTGFGSTAPPQADGIWRDLVNAVVSERGVEGVASVLHRATGRPVRVEGDDGRILAGAGRAEEAEWAGEPPAPHGLQPNATVRQGPTGWWAAFLTQGNLAGVVRLLDRAHLASGSHLLALEQTAGVLAIQAALALRPGSRDDSSSAEALIALLSGTDPAVAARRAQELGLAPGQTITVALVGSALQLPAGRWERAQRMLARSCAAGDHVVARPGGLIALLTGDVDWPAVHPALCREVGAQVLVGVGSRTRADEAARSVSDAALALCHSPQCAPPIAWFERLGVLKLFAHTNRQEVQSFIADWIEPLIVYDAKRGSQLVATLSEYFACGGELDTTAARLNVHRNTLRYRLTRIEELAGRDLAAATDRLHLELACAALAMWSSRTGHVERLVPWVTGVPA